MSTEEEIATKLAPVGARWSDSSTLNFEEKKDVISTPPSSQTELIMKTKEYKFLQSDYSTSIDGCTTYFRVVSTNKSSNKKVCNVKNKLSFLIQSQKT